MDGGSWAVKMQGVRSQLDTTDSDQQRLEAEIAASRLARQRRSRGLDLSKSSEYSSALQSIADSTALDDRAKPSGDRQKGQADTLSKLTAMAPSSTVAASRPEPMSLAAFMGGKATGPRLNRHAPQQDASDPTQFVQRTSNAPHPVFGRGGIALPGLATQPRAGRTPEPQPRSRRLSTPSPEKPESPKRTSVRERTVSTPTGPKTAPKSTSQPHTPRQIATPSLARPVQPDPRSSPQGPQISASQTPSQAFMRPPAQKELTPSLSRLQGRGFVQNMVKVSSQLQKSPSSSPSGPETSRPPSERKASVLDRWPALAASAPSPPQSPTSTPMRRARTTDQAAPAAVAAIPPRQISKSVSDGGAPKGDAGNRLGSASTFVAFQPKNSAVDELGFKQGNESKSRPMQGSAPVEPAKPLMHPTKDRARKPKKAQADEPREASALSIPAASPSLARSPSPSSATVDRAVTPPEKIWPHPIIAPNKPDFESKPPLSAPSHSSGMVGRRALPGMTQPGASPFISPKPFFVPTSASTADAAPRALPGLAGPASTPSIVQRDSAPASEPSAIHARLPSSGRPSAMDVAQAIAEESLPLAEEEPPQSEPVPTPRPRSNISPSAQAEKRRSAFERYSVVLPPLQEEATPEPTPHSTLTRAVASTFNPDMDYLDLKLTDHAQDVKQPDGLVHFYHLDEPLPRVDISPFARYTLPSPAIDSQTIQVDVLSVSGNTAFPLGNIHVFYETEILAIVHRSKSSATGLMNSTVWSWQGKATSLGESEERKLAELAKRYGTSVVPVRQLAEPVELVQCLGGTLAIRQGSRAHWANENTAMHAIRKLHGVVYVDQVELDVKSICSGFSYCLSILDTIYVWHGLGSPPDEREAGLAYGRTLTSNPDAVVVLIEGEDDEDYGMFWMALGEEAEYASADYWRWRPSVTSSPRIWSIDSSRKHPILPLTSFNQVSLPSSSVFVMDCVFELFVLVPALARGKRYDIRLALSVATDAAKLLATSRPFTPTVHILVLPSQIPVDLRVQFRDLDDVFSPDVSVDHMNILTTQEALAQLQTSSWLESQLREDFLPLGVDSSQIS
ncbi:hypothetical protein C8F01DRAFT_1102975 [Mycena amicta]|nr:hypothetical protein C8F01DRAFT_1102975 [Mycena amicta]